MKIGCISWSHRNEFAEGTYDFPAWIRHCAREANLEGVELWNNHFESLESAYLDHLSTLCREEDLELYSVATKCTFGDFSKEEVEAAKETLRTWLAAADRMGAETLRVSLAAENEREPARQRTIFESLTEVIEENSYPDIQVGIENKEPSAVQNADDVRLMNEVSKSRLKLILDNGSIIDKTTVYPFMEEVLPYSALVHAKFFDIDSNGADKVLDYNRIIPIVKESGYDGFLSIEYDSEQPASRDVPKIAAFLKSMV
jgi:sugar phosphate isomerase/epimerase